MRGHFLDLRSIPSPMSSSRSVQSGGFTLVEALMTAVVVGIFAAIATPSFSTWFGNKKVEDVTAQIEGAIREAQGEAIKKSQPCLLNIGLQVTSTPPSCLPTGPRDLTKLGIRALGNNSSNISLGTANLGSPAQIQFSFKGTISIQNTGTGLVTIYPAAGASGQVRCIAIASGIGLIRTGVYTGTNPASPTDTAACATNTP